MQAKYPEADFGEYFRFLVSCAGTEKALTEEHHIAPRKQFPELVRASEAWGGKRRFRQRRNRLVFRFVLR